VTNMDERERIRERIDTIDQEILNALSERVSLAKQIGEYKKKAGLPIVDVAREERVLEGIAEEAIRKGLPRNGAQKVYREIINLCRNIQLSETKVVFLGPQGTFCEQAAHEYFSHSNALFDERPSIADIFRSVKVREADCGLVPIENSNEGSVVATLDLLAESGLKISGEVILRVVHNLIVKPDMGLGDISEVASHPQALAQCRRYLEENLPGAKLLETKSTAAAVRLASERNRVAAIGTELAAQLHKMKVLSSGIEDNQENHTRFFVLGLEDKEPTGRDRTSILFSVKHSPGSLAQALETLSRKMINLSKIESRPTRGKPWEYVFFCDFEGHRKDKNCREALEDLQEKAIDLKILGSYQRAR
jgi:chorismate mutase/prephenate dehydratase